jgi:predicted signal transduction protein with EAL and GGDEF domain
MGISLYPNDGSDAETLIRNADTAMYHAKEAGGNNWTFFEQKMNDRAVERQSIEADLRLALTRGEFVLRYQPKIDLGSGRIVGAEALIRWQHPDRGLLLPSHFVPIAEECGLIVPVGRWVIREACAGAGLARGRLAADHHCGEHFRD